MPMRKREEFLPLFYIPLYEAVSSIYRGLQIADPDIYFLYYYEAFTEE